MKLSTFFGLCGISVGIVSLSGQLSAATLTWGNAIGASSYNSDGSALEVGSNTEQIFFELGVFQAGFTPSINNIEQWEANFTPLQPGGTSNPYAYDSSTPYFTDAVAFGNGTGTASAQQILNSDVPAGLQVYLWGYESKTITPGVDQDWLLLTGDAGPGTTPNENNWITPDVNDTTQENLNLTWDIHNSTTAVVGRIDNSTGGGDIESPQPLGLDDIQFATVPEPSSSLLLLLGALSFCYKRRR